MTWLINVDNGGTTTGFCLVDGGEVRYTKTLTPVHGLHPVFHLPGHQRPSAAGRATPGMRSSL